MHLLLYHYGKLWQSFIKPSYISENIIKLGSQYERPNVPIKRRITGNEMFCHLWSSNWFMKRALAFGKLFGFGMTFSIDPPNCWWI
ncbi:hypothetical protein Celaphus_00000484, partial [Cervus elaphus hippelaphus]